MRATIDFIPSGCWVWQDYLSPDGYARCKWRGKSYRAYRAIFEELNGPIPVGLEVHHLCDNRACVRPDHLQLVTRAEHNRIHGARITRCRNGHEYNAENTYIRPNGQRDCRACIRDRAARYRGRSLAA